MKGKLEYGKFPTGIYHVVIEEAKGFTSTKGKKQILIIYRILDGEQEGETFKEYLTFVSQKFLEAIGEPSQVKSDWDTDRWPQKELWVHVKYSEDENAWPRYAHFSAAPTAWNEGVKGTVTPVDAISPEGEEVPF